MERTKQQNEKGEKEMIYKVQVRPLGSSVWFSYGTSIDKGRAINMYRDTVLRYERVVMDGSELRLILEWNDGDYEVLEIENTSF